MITQIFRRRVHTCPPSISIGRRGLKKMITQMGLVLVLFLIAGGLGRVYAEEGSGAKKVETNEVIGEVIWFSPKINPRFIGIAYGKGETGYDIFLEIDEKVEIVHKRSLKEIKLGDTVSVTYEVVAGAPEKGRGRTKQIAKVIKFVRAARK